MNRVTDEREIRRVTSAQRGVFSKADLQVLLGDRHAEGLRRRLAALERDGVLRRFSRGFYVTDDFDLPTLSQRLAPDSFVSFGTVLAQRLIIGPRPSRHVLAAKPGKSRTYSSQGDTVTHVQVAPHLCFGTSVVDGVRIADAEKAVLDTLYFHLRGRRYPFDVYSDIAYHLLDRKRLEEYLDRYRNPKFVTFASRVLELR